jgi:hypothetical protein
MMDLWGGLFVHHEWWTVTILLGNVNPAVLTVLNWHPAHIMLAMMVSDVGRRR